MLDYKKGLYPVWTTMLIAQDWKVCRTAPRYRKKAISIKWLVTYQKKTQHGIQTGLLGVLKNLTLLKQMGNLTWPKHIGVHAHTHTLTHTNTHVTMGSSKPTVAWRICLGTEYYRANVWTTSGLVKSLHSHKHACISNSHLKLFHELRFEPAWHNTQQQIYLILFLIFSCIMGWKCSSVCLSDGSPLGFRVKDPST